VPGVRPRRARTRSSSSDRAGPNREAGNAISRDWCGRSVLYSCRHASSAACRASTDSNLDLHLVWTTTPPTRPRRNKAPRPFVWTKTADEILETLAAYCERIIWADGECETCAVVLTNGNGGRWRNYRGVGRRRRRWPCGRGSCWPARGQRLGDRPALPAAPAPGVPAVLKLIDAAVPNGLELHQDRG
jgi:hypothetical protein